jgi:6-pyruvoyltetrahydropterin/6-carboxytetrahydropterin synthase
MTLVYRSTKTYTHAQGLSCAFRQWKADSHCNKLHGYALQVRIEFEATQLDSKNWVVDFGGMKAFKTQLENMFDHKTLVADDDPSRDWYLEGLRRGTVALVCVQATGCEAFAELIHRYAEGWLEQSGYAPRVRVGLVEVSEHGGNSAIVMRKS